MARKKLARPGSVPRDFFYLGTPSTAEDLYEWCRVRRANLLSAEAAHKQSRFYRLRPETTTYYAADVARICRLCLVGLGAKDVPKITARPAGHAELIELLTWAMAWCTKKTGTSDERANNRQRNPVPLNKDVVKLAKELRRQKDSGRAKIDIALGFAEGNRKLALSLLRQVRRFPNL
jgi:hypothetical protein